VRCFSDSSSNSVVILPGLGNNAADYDDLVCQLIENYGHPAVEVASVTRLDWLRNARGLTDPNYWRGTLSPRPTVDWYLNKVEDSIGKVRDKAPGSMVTLLAHSAGGWLGRLYLKDFVPGDVTRFVSLGSPHLPPPDGVIDQTRGILTYMEAQCPGAFVERVEYVTIAGTYSTGVELFGRDGSLSDRIVGLGYKQVCGVAAVAGDGVVPVPSAHLDGAVQVTLDGVYHSPLGADEGADVTGATDSDDYTDDEGEPGENAGGESRVNRRRWYGHSEHLVKWAKYLNHEASEQ
jgi:pimeloyl-ACP methyl ester carboxylesterase